MSNLERHGVFVEPRSFPMRARDYVAVYAIGFAALIVISLAIFGARVLLGLA